MAFGRGARAAKVLAVLAWAWISGFGCSDVVTVLAPVGTVVVTPSQETIVEGEEIVLQAAARDGNGHPMQGQTLAWASSDPTIATVDATGVVRGLSPGAVSVEATIDGVSGNAQVVVVKRPQIELAAEEVSFAGVGGVQSTQPVFVEIRSGSEGTLSGLTASVEYPADSPEGWVKAELGSTTAPTNLRIEVTPEELFGGTYEAEVLVSAPSASSLARLRILFDVESRPPALRVAPGAVGFSAAEDRPLPAPQSVALTNLGERVLSGLSRTVVYPDEGPADWLSAELEDTVAPTNLRVSVAPGNLATGVYDATISVSSPVAVNGPQSVQVRLTVGDPPPEIGVEPSTVSMTHVEQSSTLPDASVDIINRGLGTLDGLSVAVAYPTGPGGWLNLDLDSPQTPAVLTLSVVRGILSLEAGDVYEAVVTISAPEAVNTPRTLNVRLQVSRRSSPENSTIQADPTSILADGVSTSAIRIQVRDPRGDPISVGGSNVSVATTAGSLSGVTDNGDGTYSAILTSATTPGTAMITGTLNGAPINDTAQVTFESAATQYRVTVNETAPYPGATVTVRAQLADANGDPVAESGRTVTWSATNGGSFSSATSTTNAAGVATVTFTTARPPPRTVHVVTATDGDDAAITGTSPTITTQPGSPSG